MMPGLLRPPLSGVIIAGGRARRLGGIPKGLLTIDGEPLVRRLLSTLRACCDEIFVVGDPTGPYCGHGADVRPDILRERGAPGGVHAALHHASNEWVYVLSCDLPFLTEASLRRLAPSRDFDVVLYTAEGRDQPLVALWRTSAIRVFEQHLAAANPGFSPLLADLRVKRVEATPSRVLTNVNTQDEAERAGLNPGEFRSLNRE